MALVKCIFCGETFDREQEEFCQFPRGKSMRYAHPYHEQCKGLPIYGHVCYICGKADELKNLTPFLKVDGLYAHPDCIATDAPDERELLNRCVMRLFNKKRVPTNILKQIKTFNEQYRYSFRAIRHTLEWWYDIEQNDIKKANENIGIVPFVIARAKTYWQAKETAVEKNKDIVITPAVDIKVQIKTPQRQRFRTMNLNFLEEAADGE